MRQYVGLVRDHSNSMAHLAKAAMQDYNELIRETKESFSSSASSIDTFVTTVKCGVGRSALVVPENVNSPLNYIQPLSNYETSGYGTPLYDSVLKCIELMQSNLYYNHGDGYLVIVVTDGEENASRYGSLDQLRHTIAELQATDHWTFVFRVPKGYKSKLVQRLGIHEGNVVEWEQSEQAMNHLTAQTQSAIRGYSAIRASGGTSTKSFYVHTDQLKTAEVKRTLVDVSQRVRWYGGMIDGESIKSFVERACGSYVIGTAYYQLTKSETVQPTKQILVVNDKTARTYTGDDAKSVLGLPYNQTIKLRPGMMNEWKIFVQSTSVNRKLANNTRVAIYS